MSCTFLSGCSCVEPVTLEAVKDILPQENNQFFLNVSGQNTHCKLLLCTAERCRVIGFLLCVDFPSERAEYEGYIIHLQGDAEDASKLTEV